MNSTYVQLKKKLEYLKLNQMDLHLDEVIDLITSSPLSFTEGLCKLTNYEIDFKEANMIRSMVKVGVFPHQKSLFDIDSQNRGVEIYNNSKLRTPNSYFILNNCGRPSGFGIEPINDFIYCLQNDLPFIADGNDGLQAELIAEAVHESLEKGVAVKLKRD